MRLIEKVDSKLSIFHCSLSAPLLLEHLFHGFFRFFSFFHFLCSVSEAASAGRLWAMARILAPGMASARIGASEVVPDHVGDCMTVRRLDSDVASPSELSSDKPFWRAGVIHSDQFSPYQKHSDSSDSVTLWQF